MGTNVLLNRPIAIFGLIALLAFARIGYAMEFSVTHTNPFSGNDDNFDSLLLRGEIKPGDYDKLLHFSISNNVNLLAVQFILESPGGDIAEALAIGRLVKGLYMPASVGHQFGRCASACFIIFASSVDRQADPNLVGIHRPYVAHERMRSLTLAEAEKEETKALLDAEKYLHELRVPNAIVDEMFANASTGIHWLSENELEQLGQWAPWYEEVLVARCGLTEHNMGYTLIDPNDLQAARRMKDVADCQAKISFSEAVKFLNAVYRPYIVHVTPSPIPGPDSVAICTSKTGVTGPCANQNR
jgi:hypothetical protein